MASPKSRKTWRFYYSNLMFPNHDVAFTVVAILMKLMTDGATIKVIFRGFWQGSEKKIYIS
jgi:hypothetical protein